MICVSSRLLTICISLWKGSHLPLSRKMGDWDYQQVLGSTFWESLTFNSVDESLFQQLYQGRSVSSVLRPRSLPGVFCSFVFAFVFPRFSVADQMSSFLEQPILYGPPHVATDGSVSTPTDPLYFLELCHWLLQPLEDKSFTYLSVVASIAHIAYQRNPFKKRALQALFGLHL